MGVEFHRRADVWPSDPLPASFRTQPVHVAMVLPGLGAGGTEHIVNVLANGWAAAGRRVTVFTFEPEGAPAYYPFHPGVTLRRLGWPPRKRAFFGGAAASLRRVRLLRRAFQASAPDVILSFLTRTNVMALAAASGLGIPVVVSERNNPELQDVGPVWRALRRHLYPRAFGLVTMTRRALETFPPAQRPRGWVIPNLVDLPAVGAYRRGAGILAAVGRLVPQKGFDLLIEAFAAIAPAFPGWTLVIWGEGPERARLEERRDRLGLSNRVELPGITEKPGLWVETADAFVLSSRFEGWGIVLLEAMAADLPVVSFDCPFGPREMVEDGETGLLVPPGDVPALAEALARVLSDDALRRRLGTAAGLSARKLTPEHVLERWDEVVDAAVPAY